MVEIEDLSKFDSLLLKRECLVSIPLEVSTIKPKLEKSIARHIRIDSVKLLLGTGKLNPLEILLVVGLELQIDKLPSSLPSHTLRDPTLLPLDHFLKPDLRDILDIIHLFNPNPPPPHPSRTAPARPTPWRAAPAAALARTQPHWADWPAARTPRPRRGELAAC